MRKQQHSENLVHIWSRYPESVSLPQIRTTSKFNRDFLVQGYGWWSGVVVGSLASINKINLCRARLVLRWATVSGFNSRCRTFISVCNQPATQGQLSLPFLRGR